MFSVTSTTSRAGVCGSHMWNDGRVPDGVVPRDDRAWPRSSLHVSAGLALAAIGSGVGLAIGAAGRGSTAIAFVTVGFVVALGFGLVVSVRALRHWVAGHAVPRRLQLLQWAGLVGGFVVAARLDVLVGCAMLAGLIGGLLIANISAIRMARTNRDIVDQAEAKLARAR